MILLYVSKLDLIVRRTNGKAQKIDGSTFETFGIVIASFQVEISSEGPDFSKKHSYWLRSDWKVVLKLT